MWINLCGVAVTYDARILVSFECEEHHGLIGAIISPGEPYFSHYFCLSRLLSVLLSWLEKSIAIYYRHTT